MLWLFSRDLSMSFEELVFCLALGPYTDTHHSLWSEDWNVVMFLCQTQTVGSQWAGRVVPINFSWNWVENSWKCLVTHSVAWIWMVCQKKLGKNWVLEAKTGKFHFFGRFSTFWRSWGLFSAPWGSETPVCRRVRILVGGGSRPNWKILFPWAWRVRPFL